MGLYSVFKTNNALEREGRWFDLTSIKNDDGTVPGFKMARMHKNNPEYQSRLERLSKELRQAIELDTLTEDIAGPVMRGVFVEAVLLDWRNVFDEDNKPIPFSKENADKLLSELPDLYLILADEARKLGNFRNAQVEEVAKKSLPPLKTPSGNDAT